MFRSTSVSTPGQIIIILLVIDFEWRKDEDPEIGSQPQLRQCYRIGPPRMVEVGAQRLNGSSAKSTPSKEERCTKRTTRSAFRITIILWLVLGSIALYNQGCQFILGNPSFSVQWPFISWPLSV